MRYKQCKFGCNVSLNKGTLLVQQSTFSVLSPLPLEHSQENSYFAVFTHALQRCKICCDWILINDTLLRKKYLCGSISAFIGGNFLKIRTSHFPRICSKRYKFGCSQSTIQGTLLGEQCGESLSEISLEDLLTDGRIILK